MWTDSGVDPGALVTDAHMLGRLVTPVVFEESSTLLRLVQVEVAVRVNPDGMAPSTRASRGWTQPARQHLAIKVEEGDQAIQLRYIDHPSWSI